MSSVLITGVSSGIGNALANWYLTHPDGATSNRVFGVSRRTPGTLLAYKSFHFSAVDLANAEAASKALSELLQNVNELDLIILNAGILGEIADMQDVSLDQLRKIMDVNVWANKTVLDTVFQNDRAVTQVVAISSGAAVNGNRGWNGYSISKAALNMLVQLYARERPDTHFCSLAPGLVETAMQEFLCGQAADERFESLENLKSKRHTTDMPTPSAAAEQLAKVFDELPGNLTSGEFADIRNLPWG